MPGEGVVYALDADVAAVDGSVAADVLLLRHRQLETTQVVGVKAATSCEAVRRVTDSHVNRICPT